MFIQQDSDVTRMPWLAGQKDEQVHENVVVVVVVIVVVVV